MCSSFWAVFTFCYFSKNKCRCKSFLWKKCRFRISWWYLISYMCNGFLCNIQCGPSMSSWVDLHPSSQKGMDRLKSKGVDRLKTSLTVHTVQHEWLQKTEKDHCTHGFFCYNKSVHCRLRWIFCNICSLSQKIINSGIAQAKWTTLKSLPISSAK